MKTEHSEAQQKTIDNIHSAVKNGKTNLIPSKTLKGSDPDHIYLETKHKETGKTHHIAIHKNGNIVDPNILHNGKFDHKTLKELPQEKRVKVKDNGLKSIKKSDNKPKVKIIKPNILDKKKEDIQSEKKKISTNPIEKQPNLDDIKEELIKSAQDEVAYNKADKSGKIEDYEAYINFYPEGNFIDSAKEKLSSLSQKKQIKKEKLKRKSKKKGK